MRRRKGGKYLVAAVVNLCVTALVRNLCQCDSANLSFILSAAATVNNLAVTVEKL